MNIKKELCNNRPEFIYLNASNNSRPLTKFRDKTPSPRSSSFLCSISGDVIILCHTPLPTPFAFSILLTNKRGNYYGRLTNSPNFPAKNIIFFHIKVTVSKKSIPFL